MISFKLRHVGLILIVGAIFLSACGSKAAHFTIEAKDNLTFTPDIITVQSGQTVQLTLVNHGKLPHTFSVPALNIEIQMPPGQTSQGTFTAPEAGEYEFSSGVLPSFDTMKGRIIVR